MFQDKNKSFYEHLNDLRKLIIILILVYIIFFIICFYFSQDLYEIFINPFMKVLSKNDLYQDFIVTAVTEIFTSYLKIAFFSSLFIYLPLFFLIIFIFLLPIFSKKERRIAILVVFLSPILFFTGIFFAYFLFLNIIWDFLVQMYLVGSGITLLPKVNEYINFTLTIILIFGIIFQLPIFLIILALLNIINLAMMKKNIKYIILFSFIIGAVVTPADPFSQIIVAVILLGLYIISFYIIKFLK